MFRRQMLPSVTAQFVAVTVTVLWHGVADGVMAPMLRYHPVVFSGREDDSITSSGHTTLIAAAGPLVNRVSGILLPVMVPRQPPGTRPGSLLLGWLALLGLETFVGYLLTAPFYGGGDVAQKLDELDAPAFFSFVVLVAGIIGPLIVAPCSRSRLLSAGAVDTGTAHGLAPVPASGGRAALAGRDHPRGRHIPARGQSNGPASSPNQRVVHPPRDGPDRVPLFLAATTRLARRNRPELVALAAAALALLVIARLLFRSGLHL